MKPVTTAIVLAAGKGHRMGGQAKALLHTPAGESLLSRVSAALLEGGCTHLVVVTGYQSGSVESVAGEAIVVHNTQWSEGQHTSFHAGVQAARELASAAMVLCPVDLPDLNAAVVTRVLTAHREGECPITRATIGATPHHPVVFDPTQAIAAAAMSAHDQGGRSYLRQYPELVRLVEVGDITSGVDIDTIEEADRWGLLRD